MTQPPDEDKVDFETTCVRTESKRLKHAPRDQLTAKEIQVATLVWEGLTNRDIAKVIGTTEQVVKNYLRTTFDKLGVWSRLELAL